MAFVKLTSASGKPILVNVERIQTVYQSRPRVRIGFGDDLDFIEVTEDFQKVILRIADATDVYLEPEPAGEEVATIRKLEEAT